MYQVEVIKVQMIQHRPSHGNLHSIIFFVTPALARMGLVPFY
jgi:hypothetical protein